MASRLQTRLERIEQQAAPVLALKRERMCEIGKLRAFIKPELDRIMEVAEYCGLPNLIDLREQIESDWIEQVLLEWAEYQERFGDAEKTIERKREAIIESDIKFYREIYGLELEPAAVLNAGELGEQVRADMRAGIMARDSEAAQEIIRSQATRAARLKKHTDDFAAFIAGQDSRIPDWVFCAE